MFISREVSMRTILGGTASVVCKLGIFGSWVGIVFVRK
jgi:hypothetical protein